MPALPWPAESPSGWPTPAVTDEPPNVGEDDDLYGWSVVDHQDPGTPVTRTKAWVTSGDWKAREERPAPGSHRAPR